MATLAVRDPLGMTQIGKYQLVRRLATGGMAEIFLARAQAIQGFEKIVVLKRILPQHAESEDFIKMFLTEARLAATLHHPNIVQVYDMGEEHGALFFTMEYVRGQDMRKIVRTARKQHRPIPLEHILHIVMGVAAGLNHAHEKVGADGQPLGIVHRDVSPSNVLVTYEGDVKLVDFGIAKAASAQVATIAGTLKGKIPYMSPEQCRGENVDRRSDIFSIGTLLWELTVGRRLFAGDNEFAVLNRVARGDVPPPSAIRPEYPEALETIVMKALQADREKRYASAVDLQIDLEDFAREARLPVSSARMGRFMREVFAEEMEASRAELIQVEQERAAPAQADVPAKTPIETPHEEYTPSEMRALSSATEGVAPGTEVEFNPSWSRWQNHRAWPAMLGVLGILAGAGALYAYNEYTGKSTPAASTAASAMDPAGGPETLTPKVASTVPPPGADEDDRADDASDERPPGAEAQPGAAASAGPDASDADAEDDVRGGAVGDDPGAESEASDADAATDPGDGADDVTAPTRRLKRPVRRKRSRPTRKSTSTSPSTTKPSYDPDSPLPPGV